MDFKSLKKIETREQYDAVCARINTLMDEAIKKGVFELEDDNAYTREIGRLSVLGARYESEFMEFTHIKVKSPLIRSIEDAMHERNLKQKDVAELIGINEPTFSQIMHGKRHVSMRMAKRLYHSLQIDPKLIVEYA